MNLISSLAIPILLFLIITYALIKKVAVYDSFIEGAKEGLASSVKIIPQLVGLISAISMFRASGALDAICNFMSPVASFIGFPKEVLPLAIIRPVSGSGATAVLNDIFKNFGTDNFTGLVASVVSGSTETTFYIIAVYYGYLGIKDIKYTAKASLMADVSSFLIAAAVVRIIFRM